MYIYIYVYIYVYIICIYIIKYQISYIIYIYVCIQGEQGARNSLKASAWSFETEVVWISNIIYMYIYNVYV